MIQNSPDIFVASAIKSVQRLARYGVDKIMAIEVVTDPLIEIAVLP